MTILPDHWIGNLSRPGVKHPLVEPFDPDRTQAASHDLTLGTEFIHFRDISDGQVVDLLEPPNGIGTKVKCDAFQLEPCEFVLGVTNERICLPDNIAGKLDGKSSLARWGLLIHVTGGNVDPGWRGPLTLEIFNAFPVPIILRSDRAICQIVFQQLTAPAVEPYSGRYQDAEGVEASKYTG
jgi:dCTP deaminase